MARNENDVRVLIAGAGIAGLAAAISLTRQTSLANLTVSLYEQADELTEIGASIALSPNGMRTLERLGVHNALSDAVGFRSPSGIPQIFRHWKTNQVHSVDTHNDVPDPRHATTRFHRGHLHTALLEHVPRESIYLGKKTVRAEADHQGVSLYFDDGTSAHGDILIGADGLRSIVRQSFIPQYKLRFSGKVFMRSTFDASLVEGKVADLPADSIHWWGPKDNFFASRLGKQQYTTVGAYSDPRTTEEIEKSVSWNDEGHVEFLRERYKDWNPVVKALTELTPYTKLYPNFIGDSLSSWVLAPRVTLIGDAAHAHGGAFAAGGSLALDDALTLGLAFAHALDGLDAEQSIPESSIQLALELYSRARQPHTERLLRIVHGQASEGQLENGDNEEDEEQRLLRRLRNRVSTVWLAEHDAETAFAATVAKVGEEKIAEKQSRGVKL
ncbi:FAD/NAD(P)-binding domain-containing protein [Aspergillus japonicus CBS 114.51]|uniref:FAD/NAD(P)-binding domain-containing protein n=1 Tax=Aspergillus japonicus CBS 114.51 TaxID=1448312 RepID=A0A8T8WVB2_ASPJA|nr:FAD/NAD(P)-binding domain-containing protein [Aspergillus japonicus CBS 114.51]RAH79594.1 FAD/NAD(P)-binding domain-containing protein [Aspergillus japonicus CBS 114.51]